LNEQLQYQTVKQTSAFLSCNVEHQRDADDRRVDRGGTKQRHWAIKT